MTIFHNKFAFLLLILCSCCFCSCSKESLLESLISSTPVLSSNPQIRENDAVFAAMSENGKQISIFYLRNGENGWEQVQEFMPDEFEHYSLQNIQFNDHWLVLTGKNTQSSRPLRYALSVITEINMGIDPATDTINSASYFIFHKENGQWSYSYQYDTLIKVGESSLLCDNDQFLFVADNPTHFDQIQTTHLSVGKGNPVKPLNLQHEDNTGELSLFSFVPLDETTILVNDSGVTFSPNERRQFNLTQEKEIGEEHGEWYVLRFDGQKWNCVDTLYREFLKDHVYRNQFGSIPKPNSAEWFGPDRIVLKDSFYIGNDKKWVGYLFEYSSENGKWRFVREISENSFEKEYVPQQTVRKKFPYFTAEQQTKAFIIYKNCEDGQKYEVYRKDLK